ncbi:hypothetical protein ACOZ4F_02940 [Haloarcula marismortui]|uniref:hypothetical protein n=1 Tax=Haloarcula TaxID=2237 RepID=UPI000EF24520|nr:hypothetical protein [Haloarcula sp. Atlit-47R]RLM44108.1 hypothetical protein DVK00_13685 [Haloarcula sp. Atlit-47R]
MHRRAVLGSLAAGVGTLFAGCTGSSVNGTVSTNETPLVLSHDYAVQATYSGTQIAVEVTAENDGDESITTDPPVPRIVCTFRSDTGEQVYQAGRTLVDAVDVGESTTLEFALGVDVDAVARYELRCKWVEE